MTGPQVPAVQRGRLNGNLPNRHISQHRPVRIAFAPEVARDFPGVRRKEIVSAVGILFQGLQETEVVLGKGFRLDPDKVLPMIPVVVPGKALQRPGRDAGFNHSGIIHRINTPAVRRSPTPITVKIRLDARRDGQGLRIENVADGVVCMELPKLFKGELEIAGSLVSAVHGNRYGNVLVTFSTKEVNAPDDRCRCGLAPVADI